MKTSPDNMEKDKIWLGDEEGDHQKDSLQEALDKIYLSSPPAGEVDKAIEATKARLRHAHREQVFYTQIPESPVGSILLAKTSRGLVALAFSSDEEKFLDEMESRTGNRASYSPHDLEFETEHIQRYLQGTIQSLDIDVDLRGLTDFQRAVLTTVSEVPRGEVITYAELAKRLHKPNAARAVGQALGRNPVPIVIPCHRVIASDGTLGGYSGERGIATKEDLLKLEDAIF